MIYLSIKVIHLACVIVWMGSMLLVPSVIASFNSVAPEARREAVALTRKRYLIITSVAMVGTWIFGLALMSLGGWMTYPWMSAKIVIVLFLSAVHGILSGQFRRLVNDEPLLIVNQSGLLTAVITVLLLSVLLFVVLKP